MNDLLVIQNEFAPALLSALIHSVWTGGILYLLLRTYLDHVAGQHAAMRYQVAVVTLMTQVLLTLLLFFAIFEPGSQTRDVAETIPFEGTPAPGLAGSVGAAGKTGFPHVSEIALAIYLAGVLFCSFRLIIISILIRQRIKPGCRTKPQYTRLLERARKRLGIRREVNLIRSDHLQSPALYGFFKPIIVVPAGMFTHLSFEQVEVILLHELIHLKKADFLVNLFQQLVESLLFFNPFTWLISRIIREEREKRVDDAVTEHCHPATYARALYNLSILQAPDSAASLAATGGGQKLLLNRIQRILKPNSMKKVIKTRVYLTAIAATGAILFISLSGFSSSLLQIDRQQTKAVNSTSFYEAGGNAANTGQDLHAVTGSGRYTAAAISVNTDEVQSAAILNSERDLGVSMGTMVTGQDTLTEKERKKLLGELERAREELGAIDWEKEIARIEEEHARLLAELPARMEEEHKRIREELSRIDEEMIRKEVDRARVHLEVDIDHDSLVFEVQKSLQEIDIKAIKEDIDRSVREIELRIEALKSSGAGKKDKK